VLVLARKYEGRREEEAEMEDGRFKGIYIYIDVTR
jgi:hypothetical protein